MTQDDPDSLDRLIDQAIDDVAREMTAARPVDGHEGFARRVSAGLHDADARAPRTWSRAWLLVPAAGAVLLAAFLVRDVPAPSPAPANANVRLKPDATATPATVATAEPPTHTPVASGVSRTAAAVPPAGLDTIAPIDVERIDISPLAAEMPIEIATIAIDRIEIAPMP